MKIGEQKDWKRAKWVVRHPNATAKDVPAWFDAETPSRYFVRTCSVVNERGYSPLSDNDRFQMTGDHLTAYEARKRELREIAWKRAETVAVIAATGIALAALLRQ